MAILPTSYSSSLFQHKYHSSFIITRTFILKQGFSYALISVKKQPNLFSDLLSLPCWITFNSFLLLMKESALLASKVPHNRAPTQNLSIPCLLCLTQTHSPNISSADSYLRTLISWFLNLKYFSSNSTTSIHTHLSFNTIQVSLHLRLKGLTKDANIIPLS